MTKSSFFIAIKFDKKPIRLKIVEISKNKEREQFRVLAKNQEFVLENNRPLLRNKGLKHKKINWKVIEGG